MQSFPLKRLLLLYLVNRPTSRHTWITLSFRNTKSCVNPIKLPIIPSIIIVVNYHRVVIVNKLSAGIVYRTWRRLRGQRASSWMYFEQGDAAWRSSRCHWKYQLVATKVTRKNRNGGKWALWTAWRDRPWREYSSEDTTKRAFGRISWYRSLDLPVDRRRPCRNGKAANP